MNLIDPEVLQSVDCFNARLQSAIARGDVQQLGTMLEALDPEQQIIARNVIERFGSKTADWMGKYCKGQIQRKFPGQMKDKTLKEIFDLSRTGNRDAKTAWKLLNDSRFRK